MSQQIKDSNSDQAKPELGTRLAGAFQVASEKVHDSLVKAREFASHAGDEIAARAESAKHTAAAAVESVREHISEGKDATVDMLGGLLDDARNMTSRMGQYIKDNPGKSFAAAAILSWLAVRQIRKPSRQARH